VWSASCPSDFMPGEGIHIYNLGSVFCISCLNYPEYNKFILGYEANDEF